VFAVRYIISFAESASRAVPLLMTRDLSDAQNMRKFMGALF